MKSTCYEIYYDAPLLPADPRPEAGIEIGGADSPKEILESKMQNAHVVGRSSGRPLGSRRTAVGRLSDGRRTVVGRSSDGPRTRPYDGRRTLHRTVEKSDFRCSCTFIEGSPHLTVPPRSLFFDTFFFGIAESICD